MAFSQGVSGLKAASTSLDVIGNNIANSQTVGFKTARAEFADMYAGARAGIGTRVAGVTQSFGSGSIEQTDRAMDLAINGNGFFRLQQGNEVVYSRNGQFNVDNQGYLVNATGGRLTGYNGVTVSGNPVELQVSNAAAPARATTTASATFNLNANAGTAESDNNTTSMTVFDSLGNSHTVNLTFAKQTTPANTWTVQASLNGDDIGPQQTVTFGSSGQMTGPAANPNATPPTAAGAFNIPITPANLGNNGAEGMNVALNLTGTTQYARAFANSSITQDGYTAGDLTGVSVSDSGQLVGRYSNNQTAVLGSVALADFRNQQGLESLGDNAWRETVGSGQALIGTVGSGQLGTLQSGALEASNVDLSDQLVAMIVAQRNYQANSQTVKTQDQIMQTLISMR